MHNMLKTLKFGSLIAGAALTGMIFVLPAQAVTLFSDRDILVEDNAIASHADTLARYKDMGDLAGAAYGTFYTSQFDITTGKRLFPDANCPSAPGGCNADTDPTIGPNPNATEPTLGSEFDNFLTGDHSAFGSGPIDMASTWTVNHEIALIYHFSVDVDFWSEVELRVGVDNGIYVWLDGIYIFGAMKSGGAPFEEYKLELPDLVGGDHVLQVLLEDHGGQTGYNLQLRGVAQQNVPEPGALALFGIGLIGLGIAARRRMAA